jgi:hypothetical protein
MTTRNRSVSRAVRATNVTAAAVLTVSAGALAWPATARAAVPDVYEMSARALAFDSTTTDPGIPLGLPFSYASYGASSVLTSNGESAADAGAPYSPLVSSLPNTGNGVAASTFGQGLPVVPTFPGYVSAKDPITPLAKQNAGGYALTATAGPGRSSGVVNMGAQSATSAENNAFAFATSTANDAGIVTEGSAGVHAFTLDGILDLFDVSSFASLTRGEDGKAVPVTRTNLGTVSFAGLTSGVTKDGAAALGSAPTPISVDGLDALNSALKPLGITLIYLPEIYAYTDGSTSTGPAVNAKKDVAGVMSGALEILITNTSDRGTTTESLTFGRVSLTATSTSLGAGAGGTSGTTPAGVIASPTDGAATGPAGVDAAALGAASSGQLPAGSPGATTPTVVEVPSQTFLPASISATLRAGTTSWESAYLILALAAGSVLVGAQVVRVLAVRGR